MANDKAALSQDIKRLINQIWKLIPMRENGEDWQSQLLVIIEEISGLQLLLSVDDLDLLIILSKLRGLICEESLADFMLFRKVVFKIISLLAEASDK